MFLKYTCDRSGALTAAHLQALCRARQLPCGPELADRLLERFGTNGRMDLEQFRKFFDK
jgi:Ca2+-binding EF-hand superfamily protein